MANKDNLLTTTMAAKILGFSANYIRRLCSKGKIKAYKIGYDWMLTKQSIGKITRKRFPKPKE